MESKIKILYIAGYGHSGSTILEILLASSKNIIGLGEVTHFGRYMENNEFETTNFKSLQSQLCKNLYMRVDTWMARNQLSYSSFVKTAACEKFFKRRKKKECEEFKELWKAFFLSAADSKSQHSIFVDSSKTAAGHAYRPLLLQEIDGIDVFCIHLIRRPESILSRMRLKTYSGQIQNRKNVLLQLFFSSFNWIFANFWPSYHSKKFSGYVRISYEELCNDPEKTLNRIEKECKVSMENPIRKISNEEILPHTCAFAGNRIKSKQGIKFNPNSSRLKSTFLESFFSFFLLPVYKILSNNS